MAQVPQDATAAALAAPAANHQVQNQESGNSVPVTASPVSAVEVAAGGDSPAPVAPAQWQRVRWTGTMVKMLVSCVSYLDDDMATDDGANCGRSKQAMLKRKGGKWRLVSSALTERGLAASPQQCEDKFNDLNKRYKRFTEIVGRGTACHVVEKPYLLETIALPEKLMAEAKKLLRSAHLCYEEMCCYHNHNWAFLIEDPELQKSLRAALRSSPDEQGNKASPGSDHGDSPMLAPGGGDGEDDGFSDDDLEGSEEDQHPHHGVHGAKKLKHSHEGGDSGSQVTAIAMGGGFSEGTAARKNPGGDYAAQIETERLKKKRGMIKREILKLEKKHLEWLRRVASGGEDEEGRELQEMRMENEKMNLENDRLELKLRIMEIQMGINKAKSG